MRKYKLAKLNKKFKRQDRNRKNVNLEDTSKKEKKENQSKKPSGKLERELADRKKFEKELKTYQRGVKAVSKRRLEENLKNDDMEIKQLEKKLKLDKRKSKNIPQSFVSDGLGYILEMCDDENRKTAAEMEKNILGSGTGSESDYENETKTNIKPNDLKKEKLKTQNKRRIQELVDFEMSEIEGSASYSGSKRSTITKSNDKKTKNISKTVDKIQVQNKISEAGTDNTEKNKNNIETWEDIYGRKRDAAGNVIVETSGKYIPPAARLNQSNNSNSEKSLRLKRQLKGLLNRLSENNMNSIASQIEELYMSNSRHDMNEVLTILLSESLISPTLKPERLILEHILLITILHSNVGTEVGAHVLQFLVEKYDALLKSEPSVENKELDGVILMISHFYNFKVIGSKLMYQILDQLAMRFMEKDIELILLILKSVGFSLRKDDPLALRDFIFKMQDQAEKTESNNLRTKFMLQTLIALKNNNPTKIPQYDPSLIEHFRKILKGFLRKGNTISPFEIGLNDLLHANERGRWWIVGSAWTGKEDLTTKSTQESEEAPLFSEKLLRIAKKRRMNTELRKNIFCTLLSSEDYLDAFDKLHRLGSKGQQARDIVYVIMYCCLYEKPFNPFYAVLAQRFCDYDRKYHLAIKYALWDKLKELDKCSTADNMNLAQLLVHLFLEKGLPLSVLKVIQLKELDKCTMKFLRRIMLGILLHQNVETCLTVFAKIVASPQLYQFKEGIRLFISVFLVKNVLEKNIRACFITDEQKELLKKRISLVDKFLSTHSSKAMF